MTPDRPLRALAHRAAARRLAGRRAGQLARRARARPRRAGWCASRTSTPPRCLPGVGETHPAAAGRLRPACRTSRRCGRRSAARCTSTRSTGCGAQAWPIPAAARARTSTRRWRAQGVAHARHGERVYPAPAATACTASRRARGASPPRGSRPTQRIRRLRWTDRRLGAQTQDVAREVGDFVLRARRRPVGLPARRGGRRCRAGHDRRRARRRPGRQHGAPDPAAARARPADAELPAHAAGAGRRRREAVQAERRRSRSTPTRRPTRWPRSTRRRGRSGLPPTSAVDAAPTRWPAWVRAVARSLQSAAVMPTALPTSPRPPARRPADDSPPATPHPLHRRLKSFVKRGGRTTDGQAARLRGVRPAASCCPTAPQPLDFDAAFGREAPTVLEIGFGMGEATAHIAGADAREELPLLRGARARRRRAAQAHRRAGPQNIRICAHDAVDVLDHMLPPGTLAGVHVFFPDPWHKTRHNKRRLIQPPLRAQAGRAPGARRLPALRHRLAALRRADAGGARRRAAAAQHAPTAYAPKPDYRPLTKFENRGLKLGHGVWDVVFERV